MTPLIIIGLGNPGGDYAATRHNIGWMVVDAFATKHSAAWTTPSSLFMHATCRLARREVHLIKPLTYMNDSGKAAKRFIGQIKATPSQCVAVVDEYNFPVGRIHLRPQGSDGGHNGLASMIKELGTDVFWRLRCGIDRNFGPGGMANYVLGAFAPEEIPARDAMIELAVKAIEEMIKSGPERAISLINR
jgi:PTH1 family peptidyl-tRNA hydrolase